MQAGHLAYDFRRRLIVDAFAWDISRRRLRGALDNDTLYALVDGAARVVLVQFLAPHTGQLGLRRQGAHRGGGPALLGHGLGTGGLGFGNQALNSYLLVRGRSEWQDLNLRPPRPEQGREGARVEAKSLFRFKASVSTRTLRKHLIWDISRDSREQASWTKCGKNIVVACWANDRRITRPGPA